MTFDNSFTVFVELKNEEADRTQSRSELLTGRKWRGEIERRYGAI